MKQKINSVITTRLFKIVLAAFVLLIAFDSALGADCDLKTAPAPPAIIRHDLTGTPSVSYCELCGYGYVTVIITTPFSGAEMTNMTVEENLGSSGLTYDSTAINPIQYSVNGGALQAGGAPAISGTDNSVLTWTSAQIPDLLSLASTATNGSFNTIAITYAVRRDAALSQVALASPATNRQIQARLDFSAFTVPPPLPATACTTLVGPAVSTLDTLPLREPLPTMTKLGRNIEAAQANYVATVYGNINDDVIWRIQVDNAGLAGLQEMQFVDLMGAGNFQINYACPNEAAALGITTANGVGPGAAGCVAATNTISPFVVNNPFGNPGNTVVDIPASDSTQIFLVGKVISSCFSSTQDNVVSNLEWGCNVDLVGAGHITQTSTGVTPANSTATMSTFVAGYGGVSGPTGLTVTPVLTGTNVTQNVGSKGTMTITITNNTGGSLKNIKLKDTLPADYVMDPTFTPTITRNGGVNGAYDGATDRITWTNPVAGTFPLNVLDKTTYLNNKVPEFDLTSSTSHAVYAAPDNVTAASDDNMLRRGETLTIVFRVVLINSSSYDKKANLDVSPEVTSDGTDPGHTASLFNTLEVTYEDFCNSSASTPAPKSFTIVTNGIPANPEDLDVTIPDLVYILTNTQNAPYLTLPVVVTNNGGHDASNYHVFVSFGATIEVMSAPAGCTPIAVTAHPGPSYQPDPWLVWYQPASIPATAAVYNCTSGTGVVPGPLAPGAGNAITLNFDVRKNLANTAADDLTFRADLVGEITLSDGKPLWFPATTSSIGNGEVDRANNYSLDGVRSRVIGFNLLKTQAVNCSENNVPPPGLPDPYVQVGEECTFNIKSGGWFGFQTPGYTYIAVNNVKVTDELPSGAAGSPASVVSPLSKQGFISSTDPVLTSDPEIHGFARTAPAAPGVGWVDWTFNNDPDNITVKDKYFGVNISSRILNDPLNLHAVQSSNILNSTFDAIFQNTSGTQEIFPIDRNTIGYPREIDRRVNLTVTEPNLTIVKRVCNESLYGIGPTCSHWVQVANDGDTYDNYIYRIAVTNGASSGGVTRAPAYDVVVSDVLDASDLSYVIPFASDGLDNDGDALADGADGNGEGTISDNIVKNGTPPTLTFSYTHSTALQKINPGTTVNLYYRVDPDQDVQPGQQLINTVSATYDTLEGATGAQSAPTGTNQALGVTNGYGARLYTTPQTTATVQMVLPVPQPKRILQLSQPNHTVIASMPTPQPASVGEEIKYELETYLPIANLRNFTITDNLPAGVRCVEAPAINLSAAPYSSAGFVPGGTITPTCTDTQVIWNFGTQALTNGASITYYDFKINFIGRVENTASTNDTNLIRNGLPAGNVNVKWTDSNNVVQTRNFTNVDVQVQEPRITLTKTFSRANADAGDVLTVTVNATNTGTATAYNLRVLDDLTLATQLTYLGNVGGLDPPDVADTTTLGVSRPIFRWNSSNPKYAIAPGASVSFTYQVSVLDSVTQPLEPLEIISNNALNPMQAKWDSLPGQSTALNTTGLIGADGTATGLRNGALPNAGSALNDYETSNFATISVPAASVSKTDQSAAVVPAIGAYKNFDIDIALPEGTTQNVVVTDNLAVGTLSYLLSNNASYDITYTFQGIASINGLAPSEAAFTAFPADNTTGSAVWNIGKVITANENDPVPGVINPHIIIHYSARIVNTTSSNAGDTLSNTALFNYRNGATGATEALTSTTAPVTVVEPSLTLAKSVSNITSPGVLPDGGDILEYTLTLNNTGNSTAYDINIVDTLPAQLSYYASFTPTATIAGVGVAGFVPLPGAAPAGPLVWGRNNADASLDLPAGQSLVVTYRVIVASNAEPNTVLSNSVYADWTSLNGTSSFERTGNGCPAITAPDDHCVGPAVATTTIIDKNAIAKTVIDDSYVVGGLSTAIDSTVRLGDTVTYRLSVALQEGRTRNVVVSDALPAGMAFDSMLSINGVAVAPYSPPVAGSGSNFSYTLSSYPTAGQTGTLTWNFGTITNDPLGDATTDTIVIEFKAKVVPVPLGTPTTIPQVASTTLTNTSTLTYIDGNGAASPSVGRLTSNAPVTVVQPVISSLTKTEATHISGSQVNAVPPGAGGTIMNFRLSACNTGGAPAYSVVLTDTLASEFDNSTITALSSALKLEPDVTINGVLGVAATDYTYTPPPADAGSFTVSLNKAVNPGQCVYVDFYIGFDNVAPIHAWNNTVNLSPYWSLPGAVPTLSGQEYAGLGPVNFGMNNVATLPTPTKTVQSSTGTVAGEVAIGDELVYRITLPGSSVPGTLFDVKLSDALNSSLVFVSATKTVSGVTTSVSNSGTASSVLLDLGDVPNQAVVDLHVRVDNSTVSNAGVLIDNTATFTYAVTSGGVAINGGAANTVVGDRQKIVEPLVALSKTVANITKPGLPPNAGDVLRYTLVMNASGGVANDNFSNAYDISIADTLGLGLLYQGNPTVTGAGNNIAAPSVVSGNGVSAPQVLNWNLANGSNIDINEGTSVTVTYDVVVLDSALANQALSNSAVAQWTSLNGSNAFERNGSNSPGYNDYFTTPAIATLTTSSPTMSKAQSATTYGPGNVVRIGDVVEYTLQLHLQEGTTAAAVVNDVLPKGLKFEGTVSINGNTTSPFANVAPFTHANIAAPVVSGNPQTGPSTVSWSIGNIVSAGDNNTANDDFVIVYRARVLDNYAFAQTPSTQSVSNNASLDYTSATGAASISVAVPPSLSVRQPLLSVTKVSSPVNGSIIASGATVTYTVDVANTGTAPAYDVQLRDVIPLGLRSATITMVAPPTLLSGPVLPVFTPVYSAITGVVTWNFSTGTSYTIPAGDTLRLVYSVTADANLGSGLSMTNSAQVQDYCSFDNDAVPVLGSVTGVRQCYGTSNTATSTLITAAPNPLGKANTQATAAIGDQFKYRITIPATTQPTALYDVRVLDNLALSAADISYVSITQVSGPAWTPVVTEAPAKNLVISGSGTGLDIPAGQQVVFDVTVVLNNSATNVSGLLFHNTASYTYNQFNDNNTTQASGGAGVTADMTIIGPDSVTLTKTGPATMRPTVPGTFTLDVHNTGTGTAWDMTVVDILPNPTPGGMCDVPPSAITATVNGTLLTPGTDYTSSFAGATACTLTLTMTSALAGILPGNHLIVTYQALLDADNYTGATLTNIAGATQWFSGNTPANVATGQIHTYTRTITDGTPGTLDHQDALSITTETADLLFQKTVAKVTSSGLVSGANANPGDLLRYTITIKNQNTLPLSNFTLTDELDRLNATAMFEPGSLNLISVTNSTYTNASNPTGGAKGTGLLEIRNLNIDAQGGPNANLTIVFEARLAPVITNYTVVLNQAQLPTITNPPLNSDDLINGTNTVPAVPTPTTISSAPVFQVRKTSQDMTGDPSVLLAGERLHYTITVKNIGNENASNVTLKDAIPANTGYIAGTTQLNGVTVPDISGASPLQNGMLINAPENLTTGVMRADAGATVSNVATVTFDVLVSATALNGTIISNQGFVNGSGLGSGIFPEKPSDDPATTAPDDPTLNIVGNFPLVVAQKTVAIRAPDNGTVGIVDPLDYLRYTITITNLSAIPATGVKLTDLVPANTSYVADSVTLNGIAVGVPDGGVSPLIAGVVVNSPASVSGTIAAHSSAVMTFDVRVNAGVATGTVISNQGNVTSNELPNQQTDADGNSSNGYQPTTIVVGSAQQVTITKQVSVVGGGPALAGGQLEYLVRVTNNGTVAASNIVITDDLGVAPLATQVTYVAGSATLNGSPAGITYAASVLTGDYAGFYGNLLPGASAQLRFRVLINASLSVGTTITNTGQVNWNSPAITATASASIDVGGVPGSAMLNGHVWHDANFNNAPDTGELNLSGWSVGVYRNNILLGSVNTDSNGIYGFSGLTPTTSVADQYVVRFLAPAAIATTAKLGHANSVFTNGMQEISAITALSGNNLQNLNMPIQPNGVTYNSILRTPVTGTVLTMSRAGSTVALPSACFDDPAQQGQVTLPYGYYKFDMNFSDPACPSGADYLIQLTTPLAYLPGQSLIVPPLTDATTATFSVPTCPAGAADAIPATNNYCEAQPSEFAPGLAIPANTAGTNYYLKLALNNTFVPGHSQIFNNHIALDPRLDNAVTITKISPLQNVTKGQLIPYTITVSNSLSVTLNNMSIVDTFPPGFKYVAGSGRLDGLPVEPVSTTRQLTWSNLQLTSNTKRVIQLLLIVGSGVKEGKYVNRAQVFNTVTGGAGSPVASATVRVIPDPTLDCSDVIGKVFDDANVNGYQDEGEMGLPGVRVVSTSGLIVTTDKFGRFHLTCAVVPDPDRGSNYILKLDDRSLPSGYRLTTENPRVQRATRGKMLKFNFGAAIHRVVKLDMADAVFEPGTAEIRVQWRQRVELLISELKKSASVLRLSYLAETEEESLVNKRLEVVKAEVARMWKKKKGSYDLDIETEVFWRTGSPPDKGSFGK